MKATTTVKAVIILIICIIITNLNTYSQTNLRDSLYACLKQNLTQDQEIKLFMQIALVNLELQNDTSILYGKKALALSCTNEKLSTKYKAEILGILGEAYENVNKEKSIRYFLKSLSLYQKKENKYKIYESHVRLSIIYTSIHDLKNAKNHLNEANAIYETYQLKDENFQLEFATAIYWYTAQDFTKASDAYIELISKLENSNEYRRISQAYLNLGACYYFLNKSDSCVNTCYKAIRLDDKHKFMQPAFRINFLNTIAASYLKLDRIADANTIFKQNINISKKANLISSLIVAYNNYAYTCRLQNNYEESLEILFIANKLIDENKYVAESMEIDTGIGESLLKLNRTNESICFIKRALRKAETNNNITLQIENNINLGEALNNDQSIYFYQNALELAEKGKLFEMVYDCYEKIIQTLNNDQKNSQLDEYYTKLLALKDTIYQTSRFKEIEEIETKYETEKKEQQIHLLQLEDEKNQLIISKAKQLNYAMMGALGLLILILIPSGLYLRQRQKSKLLQQKIAAEEKESSRIAKELHDGVASQLSYVHSFISKQGTDEEVVRMVKTAREEVRAISHKLNIPSLAKLNLKDALYDGLNLSHWDPDVKIRIALNPQNLDIANENIKKNIIRIIQELMANNLKHAQASEVILTMTQMEDKINLTYQDNGIGFDKDRIQPGHGLLSIEERVKNISGKMQYQTAPNQGVKVNIQV